MKKENNKMSCHSRVFLSGISTLIKQSGGDPRLQASGMTNGAAKGFTLLEILIAVVIIGVLAAIAVSAYQKAVLKSRFSAVIPPTKTTAEAQEFHYMREGSYATDTEDLDVKLNNGSNTITVSDKRTYKYVMGTPNNAENNHYIVYQKHSKRFAGDVHCEAQKDDARAKWLCETSLGGTLLTGSISGSDWLTYLLSGEGNGKFIREDCPAGYYDNNGTCTIAGYGQYAEEGEVKSCEPGTYSDGQGKTACTPCPEGKSQPYGGLGWCYECGAGSYNDTTGNASCKSCPAGTYQDQQGSTSCKPCPEGKYQPYGGLGWCYDCPSGKTSNEDHTGCI